MRYQTRGGERAETLQRRFETAVLLVRHARKSGATRHSNAVETRRPAHGQPLPLRGEARGRAVRSTMQETVGRVSGRVVGDGSDAR